MAVPVFLLLTSLTYLVFKLLPRSVAKGCVCLSVNVCVWGCVVGGVSWAKPAVPPHQLVLDGVGGLKPLPWTCGEFPSCQVCWGSRAPKIRGIQILRDEPPRILFSCLWRYSVVC